MTNNRKHVYIIQGSDDNVEKFFSMKFFLYPECRLSFPSLRKINSALEKLQPDVVQLMTEFNMGVVGMNYANKNNIISLFKLSNRKKARG